MLYPIPPAQNGKVYNSNKINTGSTGKYQLQWSDDYMVITTTQKDGRAHKSIYIGSIAVQGGQWDLGNSNITHEARFEYRPNAEKEISTGGCETPTPYDPDFICSSPISITTQTQPAESGLLYKNPGGLVNRPIMDEGRYEHQRLTLFRYSSFGEFDDVVTDLDRISGHHPLTENRSVVSKNKLEKFVPKNWWEDPFTSIKKGKKNGGSPSEEAKLDISKPTKFKVKNIDKINNFNPSSDTLEIDIDSFGIDSSATFSSGKNKKAIKKKLAKQDFDFLYDEKKGGLYFNENGADKGFGDGGIIAILKGAPDLTSDNLEFI